MVDCYRRWIARHANCLPPLPGRLQPRHSAASSLEDKVEEEEEEEECQASGSEDGQGRSGGRRRRIRFVSAAPGGMVMPSGSLASEWPPGSRPLTTPGRPAPAPSAAPRPLKHTRARHQRSTRAPGTATHFRTTLWHAAELTPEQVAELHEAYLAQVGGSKGGGGSGAGSRPCPLAPAAHRQ